MEITDYSMVYQAVYRFRDGFDLKTTLITFTAKSMKDAKITAKNMEGEDGKEYLMEVVKGNYYKEVTP